ncbi:MAG: sensor histidine kinase [Mucilaginibacter sp.]|jgi:two-component sensor histidine kinase|uniref:tetratricopeptide repeat-containing sensor histidine kinase n=1 Tax=Mucilaginibacter sp. TaxID=1882438 RepID=UPI003562B375
MVRKFSILLTFLLIGAAFNSRAQSIDAAYEHNLKILLRSQLSDTTRIDIMHKLGVWHTDRYLLTLNSREPDNALKVLQKALKLSKNIGDDDRKFESIRLMANAYLFLNDTVRARRCITATLDYLKAKRQFSQVVVACLQHGKAAYSALYPALCARYCDHALSVAVSNHLQRLIVPAKTWVLFAKEGNGRDVLPEALAMVAQYRNSGENLDRVYAQLARRYRYRGDLKTALSYALASTRDMQRHRDTAFVSYAYAELAQAYDVLGEAERSVYYYRMTLQARSKLAQREEYKYRTLGFIIANLIKLGRPKEALNELITYQRAFPPQSDFGKAFCDQNKAYCYEALVNYNKAEHYYLRLLKSPVMALPNDISCLAYYDICRFYVLKKAYKLAQYYMNKSNCTPSAFDNVKNLEQIRYKIDSALGNYRSAMQHYANYQRAKDSIFNKSTVREMSEMQLKYKAAQRENDIALLKKDSQIQRDRLKQADYQRNLTFVGIALLSLALLFVYRVLINIRKKTKVIDHNNITLKHLLDEKEWLIKEIHHRVKNNLQIVIGLLQRQSSYIDNDIALKAIQNSENRMHAIALIHQKLYQVDTLKQINMQEYIEDLILHLRETADTDVNITFVKQLEGIYLDVSQAVPLGLILNEAITNAIKYAYPGGSEGKIYVELTQLTDNNILLKVKDDGAGLGIAFDLKSVKSMGINLMKGLSKQLGGDFDFNLENGVAIVVRFKREQFVKANH